MNKLIVILLFILPTLPLTAQVKVPGASKQPAWVFPFYFADGGGNRDTIYLCYDPSASDTQMDTAFGEKWKWINTNKMGADMGNKPGVWDSVLKVMVFNEFQLKNSDGSFEFPVGWYNLYDSLVITWDKELLYSDTLPFPNQNPAPRAEGVVYASSGINGCAMEVYPNYLTDSVTYSNVCCHCILTDSIVHHSDRSGSFNINFQPWTGVYIYTGIDEKMKGESLFEISPNPFSEYFYIHSNEVKYSYTLFDVLGRERIRKKEAIYAEKIVNKSGLSPGLYILRIVTPDGKVSSQRLLKE